MSYPAVSVIWSVTSPLSTSSRASASAISRITSRALPKGYGYCSTWPEPILLDSGRYALISAMVQDSQPQAWSMSSSALTPNSLYSRSSLW